MSAGSGGDAAKKFEDSQAVLTDARKRKESIKKEYFAFVEDMGRSIAGERNALLDAENQAKFFNGALGSEDKIERIKGQLADLEQEVEVKRLDCKAQIEKVEEEIKAAEEQVETSFRALPLPVEEKAPPVAAPSTDSRAAIGAKITVEEVIKTDRQKVDSKKRAAEDAMRIAQNAYNKGKLAEANKVLSEARATLTLAGVFPDSKAKSHTLSGRLYALQKQIDIDAANNKGGTDLITRSAEERGGWDARLEDIGLLEQMIVRVVEMRQVDENLHV